MCMKDKMGNWINGNREILEFIREGFSNLFTSGLTISSLVEWNPLVDIPILMRHMSQILIDRLLMLKLGAQTF